MSYKIFYQYISSVYIINFPFLIFPYSIGVNEIINVVPSVPNFSNSPYFGITVNSGSESGVNYAIKCAYNLLLLVNLNETEVVLCKGEEITIRSSCLGSVDSRIIRYLKNNKIKIINMSII